MRAKYGEPLRWLRQVALRQERRCIEWPFGVTRAGYGYVRVGSTRQHAHRYVCILVHGEPGPGQTDVAHSCGNRLCCNPAHLRHATSAENSEDAMRHGTVRKGDNHPAAKLTSADVSTIRTMLGARSMSEIARDFRVSRKAVAHIRDGATWAAA
ncbi:HNH endonuclease [Xanthomonas sp. 3376]|uniref:HNH endonuclease n=1 Tax=Xanthomonas arboricola TaxID=56448 RepID=UPI00142FB782